MHCKKFTEIYVIGLYKLKKYNFLCKEKYLKIRKIKPKTVEKLLSKKSTQSFIKIRFLSLKKIHKYTYEVLYQKVKHKNLFTYLNTYTYIETRIFRFLGWYGCFIKADLNGNSSNLSKFTVFVWSISKSKKPNRSRKTNQDIVNHYTCFTILQGNYRIE